MAAFNSAKIGGQFTARGAKFENHTGTALILQDAEVKGLMWLADFPHPPIGVLDFKNAKLSAVAIDDNSYPLGHLNLDGTRYDKLIRSDWTAHTACEGWLHPNAAVGALRYRAAFDALFENRKSYPDINDAPDVRKRIMSRLADSVKRQNSSQRSPFAFRQFAKVLDANGHELEARDARVEMGHAFTTRQISAVSTFWRGPYRFWRWLLRGITGYGAKPWRVLNWLGAAWLIGGIIFAFNHKDMTPAKERFYMASVTPNAPIPKPYTHGDPLPEGYPRFSPFIYALDVMLPIVDIAQETHWRPRGKSNWYHRWLLYFNRIYLLMGWLLTSIGVAGLTGLISDKREP